MYEQNLAIFVFMYIMIVYRMLMSLRSQILLQRQTGKGNNDMFISLLNKQTLLMNMITVYMLCIKVLFVHASE